MTRKSLRKRGRHAISCRKNFDQRRELETPESKKSELEKFYEDPENALQPSTRKPKRDLRTRHDDLKNENAKLKRRVAAAIAARDEATAARDEAMGAANKAEQAKRRVMSQRNTDKQRERRRQESLSTRRLKRRKTMENAHKELRQLAGDAGAASRSKRKRLRRQLKRARDSVMDDVLEVAGLTAREREQGERDIGEFKIVFLPLEDSEEDEKVERTKVVNIYDGIVDAKLSQRQIRTVVNGIKCAVHGVTSSECERYSRNATDDAADVLGLELRTNGTVASPLSALGSSLEYQHLAPSDFAKSDLSIVPIFSWDAWPVCKGGERSFPCSTYGARVIVVRDRLNEKALSEVVNYGFTDKPGAIAVFARVVANDREQVLLDNDCGVEAIIKQFLEARERGEQFFLSLKLHDEEVCVPVCTMWRSLDAKAARDFSRDPASAHCFFGCGWLPGVDPREPLRNINLDKTAGKSELSRVHPLLDPLHHVKNFGPNVIGLITYRFNRYTGSGDSRQLTKSDYSARANEAAVILAEYGIYKTLNITQTDKVCITATTASAAAKLFKCATLRGVDAPSHKCFVVSRFANALFHDTPLLGDVLEYVNKCAEVIQSLSHTPTADADALEMLVAPRTTGRASRSPFAVNRLPRFERLIKERNDAADALGLDRLEQCFLYMHITRCHLVDVRRLMLKEADIDVRFASQSATEQRHKEDKKCACHCFHQLSELLPGVERRRDVVKEMSKRHKRRKLEEMAEERGLTKGGNKPQLASRILGYDIFVDQRKAELAKADADAEVKRKMQRDDATFSMFKHAAMDQRRAVKKLRGLTEDDIIDARNKENKRKRLSEESSHIHPRAIV